MNTIFLTAAISLLTGLLSTPLLIPFLKRLKFGQSIREEGPAWHQKKSGTPTMGGIAIILSCVLAGLISAKVYYGKIKADICILVISSVLFGVVGFIDDFIKVVMKRNLGLTARAKFLLQLFVSVLSVVALMYTGAIDSKIIIPFFKETVDIGLFIVPLVILVFLSVSNSANLTDGLDGLASSVTLVISLFLTIVAFLMGKMSVAVYMAALSGALISFLFFNSNPAKVFMGDTGSLFIGGAVALGGAMLGISVVLIIVCGVYLIETLSVIIQVVSYKTTGKRVFKMSPLHHHFEMCGMSEKKIVLLFSAMEVVLCVIGYLSIMNFC